MKSVKIELTIPSDLDGLKACKIICKIVNRKICIEERAGSKLIVTSVKSVKTILKSNRVLDRLTQHNIKPRP
ncbi:MAG: hypothetical protein ABIJ81_01565 [Patescibacteria group bacterium]